MNLRPKTKRRLLALTAGGLITSAAASVLVYVQLNREANRERALRAGGLEAYHRGDYRTAVADFSKYLNSGNADTETIFAYAVSRSKIPSPDFSNLRAAKSLFNQYLEFKPGDIAAEHQLLDIYQQMNYAAETRTLADTLLASYPDDIPALAAKVRILTNRGEYSDALRFSLHLNQLAPLDLPSQECTYNLMLRCNRPASELINRADQMTAAHPGDPRFELLRADVASLTGDAAGARQWLVAAAGRKIPDSQTLQMLCFALDRIGLWNDSRSLLENNAAQANAPAETIASWALRLWQSGQIDQALACLKSVFPSDARPDPRLLGLKAMLLYAENSSVKSSGIASDAAAALAALVDSDSPQAGCWSSLIHADYLEGTDNPLRAIEFCEQACRQDPANPVARFDLGRAYLRIGENALALKCLHQSTELAPAWSSPWVLTARALLESGQGDRAIIPAQSAFDRDPTSPAAQTTLAIATAAQLGPKAGPDEIAAALRSVQPVYEAYPTEPRVLQAWCNLLARSGAHLDATDLIMAALASPSTTSEVLRMLLEVSQVNHLDLDTPIADRVAQMPISTAAELSDHVHIFVSTGRAPDARRAITACSEHNTPDWQLAALQARELVGDTNLTAAWTDLADANPTDLGIQHAALNSPCANSNRDLIDRVIRRCRDLTGSYAIEWRLARARWQLQATDDQRNYAAAVAASMTEVTDAVPQMLEPQLLWAEALQRLGDNDGAIARLQSALVIAPNNPKVKINLAHLLTEQGRYRDAGHLIDNLAGDSDLSSHDRQQAARIFIQAGEPANAISVLSDGSSGPDTAMELLLARIYMDQGEDEKAAKIFKHLMRDTVPSNAVLRAASWFEASRGSVAEARATLDRLDPSHAAAGEIQIIHADFEADFGTAQSAVSAYQAATQEAPTNPQTWTALAEYQLRHRNFTAVCSTADSGLRWFPTDPKLSALKRQSSSLSRLLPDANFQPLIDALATDPTSVPAITLLHELLASQSSNETSDKALQRLTAVAQQNPRFLPAQLILASRFAEAGLYDDAARIAQQASESWPASAQPLKLLAQIHASANHWQLSLTAARDWRNHSLSHPQPADNSIALAMEHLGQADQAQAALSPYLPRAMPAVLADPDADSDDATTISLLARAMAMQHHLEEVRIMLEPLSQKSARWRKERETVSAG